MSAGSAGLQAALASMPCNGSSRTSAWRTPTSVPGVIEVPGAGPVAVAVLTSTRDQGAYPPGGPDTFVDEVHRQIGRVARTVYDHLHADER